MVCVIDTSNIFFITYARFKKNLIDKYGKDYLIKEEELGLLYHMFLNKIMPYLTTYKDVVLCFEGKHSTAWRKSIWKPYKENRDRRDPNYQWVSPAINKCKDFLSCLPVKILEVENCEGDDCIYAACKYYTEKNEQVEIVSNDKDLSQIMNYFEGVSQFNPITRTYINKNENVLLEKAIVGDTSDNIKPFKGIGPKTFQKMMDDKEFWTKKMTPENLEILDEVLKIVDLRKYPAKYQEAIRAELEKPTPEMDYQEIDKFFFENNLTSCYNSWENNWKPTIQSLSFEEKDDCIDDIMSILGD